MNIKYKNEPMTLSSNISTKRILMYTKFFGREELFSTSICKKLNCELTNDKKLFDSSDAVVFHHADLNEITKYPQRAFKSQKFVFFSMESPFLTAFANRSNYFNWIMSYHNKSDVVCTYGSKWRKCNATCNHLSFNSSKILSKKIKKGVIGYISNCYSNSARGKLIKKLRKYIPITMYGRCSLYQEIDGSCNKSDYKCEEEVIGNYYFYIAFENSICNNYVTEKYWRRYTFDSVPLVIKRYIYEDVGIPGNSFIAVDDFKSAEEMGKYLNFLMDNPNEYLKYFEYRKQNIEVIDIDIYRQSNGFCNLCQKLRNHSNNNLVINDVNIILIDNNNCILKRNMNQFADSW
uniref:Fucosyltransferase n=1 Tax=Parastrongyloides trichosuri TaxID=131310 RepID=A0A0N4ZI44_PARTI